MLTNRIRKSLAATFAIALIGSLAQAPQAQALGVSVNASADAAAAMVKAAQQANNFDDTQSKAFVLVMDGKTDEAEKQIEAAAKVEKDTAKRNNLIYMLSAIEYQEEKFDQAINHLQSVLNAQPAPKTVDDHLARALVLKRIGDCHYGNRNIPQALNSYKAAQAECFALPANNPLTPSILESVTGTYVFQKDYANAEVTAKQLLATTTEMAKSNHIEDIGALFWARLQLLGVYRHEGKEEERKKLWADSMPLFNKLLALRAQVETSSGEDMPDLEAMRKEFEERYIAAYHPQSPAEYLWLAGEFKMRTLPLIQWTSTGGPAKAAILCIHGLGLENRAFTPFARAMTSRGFTVYALDVRGFGSWQTTQGQEDVQFNETLKDIGGVLTLIKQRENGLPMFLLGESMGGAIALRGAAAYGSMLNGVISSVPSAERFQGKRMGMTVAFNLLKGGKDKPFRVGDMVTNQATKNEDLAERWKSDYKAKMDMSPKELIKFAVFMRTTKSECEKITTPVFVVQGLKDRLVKPQGTFDLFDAVKGEDKDLFILGTEEHLIFETIKPYPLLLDTMSAWMNEHLAAPSTTAGTTANKTATGSK
jgi:acylglycerol lipase